MAKVPGQKTWVGDARRVHTLLYHLPVGSKVIKEETEWIVYTKFFTAKDRTLEKALEGAMRHVRD